jgi:kumamolisin
MAIVLPLRNQAELQGLLGRIYDPADPLYGHYLSPKEFTDRFGPTQADYDAVTAYARSLGFTVTGTHPNRILLDVSGPARTVETAFTLHLQHYQALNGREFYAPDNDPQVPGTIASRIVGVVGLDSAAVWHPHNRSISAAEMAQSSPFQIGTGPDYGLAPNDILTAYNLQGVAANGSGQTLGLFELDGFNASDVAVYVSYFGLPPVPVTTVLNDGATGSAGSNADEVTLDIELQIALAPGASKIIVYEGPNTGTGLLDTYNAIANDNVNLPMQISTSWGLSEGQIGTTIMNSENNIFQQMAAQGQSIYAASGDHGAYDDTGTPNTLAVDDPASQPFMVGTGGTTLSVNSGSETYLSETTWSGSGGGISSYSYDSSNYWPIPSWQQGIASEASATMRNVPDVSFNADPNTGYSIYYNGGWTIYGGTSCAAPLWAAFTARVNQQRAASGNPTLGFANPAIYQLATGSSYGSDFHDVTTGSNAYYSAGTGYDNATGWGSFNGANLLAALASISVSPHTPAPPTNVTASAGNGQAIVIFSAPASNGGSAITSYTVTGTPSTGSTKTATGTASPITIHGLKNGTAYTFTATATNAVGAGLPSTPSNSVTPSSSDTTPGAPTDVTATAGNGQATVSFTAPASDGGSAILYYTATSSPGNNAATGSNSPITITGLTNGTGYTFTVTATNGDGAGPASTASSSVTPATVPGAPTISSVTAGNAQVTVVFTAPASNGGSAITGYTVTSSPAGGVDSNAGTTGLSHVVTGLINGTAYTFTVAATNSIGTGPASSASASVTPATVPGAPTISSVTAGNAQVTVVFTAPASDGGSAITGYTVASSPAGGVDSNAGSTGLSHIVTGLTNGTAYTFTVTATNEEGTGPASEPSNSVIPAGTPSAVPATTPLTLVGTGLALFVMLLRRKNS